jgi:hypothetical protein
MVTKFLAILSIACMAVAVGGHAFGLDWLADWAGGTAYFALTAAVVASYVEARAQRRS